MHMRKRVKGSLTVEAAIIIPLAIFVVGVLMYSLFYYHDKIVLNAAASETAIYGSYVKEPREEELKEHMDKLIAVSEQLMADEKMDGDEFRRIMES